MKQEELLALLKGELVKVKEHKEKNKSQNDPDLGDILSELIGWLESTITSTDAPILSSPEVVYLSSLGLTRYIRFRKRAGYRILNRHKAITSHFLYYPCEFDYDFS